MAYNLDEVDDIRILPRALAVAAGLRKLSPRPDNIPFRMVEVAPIDTGGAFRPDWRMQAPSRDPKEPYENESNGAGEDHAWSNCTMVSAALVYAYHVQDKSGPQGGDMRHNQGDFSGGTDLYDAETAWRNYGNQDLVIKSGKGWSELKKCHNDGRAIIIQGEGNVPGTESYDGAHACAIGPETNSDGKWLFGDPLASGWQWIAPDNIKEWAQRFNSSISFAVSKMPPMPTPEPVPPKDEEVHVGEVDTEAVEAAAVGAYQTEVLADMYYWFQHPETQPPFPLADTIAAIGHLNEGWDIGKWSQTTWYLASDAARWNEATWSTGSVWA